MRDAATDLAWLDKKLLETTHPIPGYEPGFLNEALALAPYWIKQGQRTDELKWFETGIALARTSPGYQTHFISEALTMARYSMLRAIDDG